MIRVHLFSGPMDGQEYEVEFVTEILCSAPPQPIDVTTPDRIMHGRYGNPGRDASGRIVLQWLGWTYG